MFLGGDIILQPLNYTINFAFNSKGDIFWIKGQRIFRADIRFKSINP